MKASGFDRTQQGQRIDNIPNTGTLTGNWATDTYGCWWEYRLDSFDSSGDVDSFAWIIGDYPAYDQKKCEKCQVDLIKRNKPPRTATRDGHKFFEYWQCPKCKTNYAYGKGS